MATDPQLSGTDVHIWKVFLPLFEEQVCLLRQTLSDTEVSRADRFCSASLRNSFVIRRGVLRCLLGNYLNIEPQALCFAMGSKGKPAIMNDSEARFNASQSGPWALVALTLGCEIGIDVEVMRSATDHLDIAARYFCREEADEIASLSEFERNTAFYRCWTRKEAYVKAIGDGLSMPLNRFRVSVTADDPAHFIYVRHDADSVHDWKLHDLSSISEGYAAALAYRGQRRSMSLHSALSKSFVADTLFGFGDMNFRT